MPTQKDEKKAKSSQKKIRRKKNHLLQKQSLKQVKRILQKERQVFAIKDIGTGKRYYFSSATG